MKSGSEITSTIPVHYILLEGRGFIHIFEYFAFGYIIVKFAQSWELSEPRDLTAVSPHTIADHMSLSTVTV